MAQIIQATEQAANQVKEFESSAQAFSGIQSINCSLPELQTAKGFADLWNDLVSTLQIYARCIKEDCYEMSEFIQAMQSLDQEARIKHDTWNVGFRSK